ncbi:hypothetical protein N665_3219s0004 [Sinapis alba]|nr:hypothetical protein N665_3219s0004 [Sinapis alba]
MQKVCRCGEAVQIRTSKTHKNSRRLFHCCLYGSKSKIDEMRDLVAGYEKDIEAIKNVIHKCEKEAEECKRDVQSLKNIIVCRFFVIVV